MKRLRTIADSDTGLVPLPPTIRRLLDYIDALEKVALAGLNCLDYYGGDTHSGPIKRMNVALREAGWLEEETK